MAGFKKNEKLRGIQHLSGGTTTTCTLADTYYKVGGTWVDGDFNNAFTLDGSGKMTYNGPSGVAFAFDGVSDLSVNFGGSMTTYGLYVNGVLYPGAETPADFDVLNSIQNISITSFLRLNPGDELEVYCKNDNAGTIVTHNTLTIRAMEA